MQEDINSGKRFGDFVSVGLMWGASSVIAALVDGMGSMPDTLSVGQQLQFGGSLWSALAFLLMTLVVIAHFAVALARGVAGRLSGVRRSIAGRLLHAMIQPLVFAVIATPWSWMVSTKLFSGGSASRISGGQALAIVVFLLLTAMVFAGTALYGRLRERMEHNRRWTVRIFIAGLFIAAALCCHWCDVYLYRRLYGYLHLTLSLATLVALLIGMDIVLLPGRLLKKHWVGLLFAWIAMGCVSFYLLFVANPAQQVKIALFDGTATLSDVLDLTPDGLERIRARCNGNKDEILTPNIQWSPVSPLSDAYPTFADADLILISVDALRADRIGVYGYEKRNLTPHIDRWAQSGTVFEHAYCAAPHSSFSITSFHTSRNTHVEANLQQTINSPTIADTLRAAGYSTAAIYTDGIFFSKGELVSHYRKHRFGFEKVVHMGRDSHQLTQQAKAIIDANTGVGKPPLFLWVHYFNVHEPYRATTYGTSPLERYESEISVADAEIGELLQYVQTHITRQTVVIFTADHGEEFQEHGGYFHGSSLYEEQVGVPLVIRVPHSQTPRIHQGVSLLDLAPTALRLLDVPLPMSMLGRDLRPGILGAESDLPAAIVYSSVMNQYMALSYPWKFITSPTRDLHWLFHLENDAEETVNLYDSNRNHAEILRTGLQRWLGTVAATDDSVAYALNLGRMRDPRAERLLLQLAIDATSPLEQRVEALTLLTDLKVKQDVAPLHALLTDPEESIRLHAALALCAIYDASGAAVLWENLATAPKPLAHQIAMALANVGDKKVVPLLIDVAVNGKPDLQKGAVRYLGGFGDKTATLPLISLLEERSLRSMVALALGKIGDKRAVSPLLQCLKTETFPNVRQSIVIALGLLKASSAREPLLQIVLTEHELPDASVSLLQTGAMAAHMVEGIDFGTLSIKRSPAFAKCVDAPPFEMKRSIEGAYCTTSGAAATVTYKSPAFVSDMLFVRIRVPLKSVNAEVLFDGVSVGTFKAGEQWRTQGFSLPHTNITSGPHRITISLSDNVPFQWDHFFFVPSL